VKPLKVWLRVDSVPPFTRFGARFGVCSLEAGFDWVPRDMAAILWFAMESAMAATMFAALLH
jgi:hypothetical protein